MSHREKVAWLSLLAIAVALTPYFVVMQLRPPTGQLANVVLIKRFAVAAVVQVLILGAGHLMLRLSAPQDARAAADERDLAIERRSTRIAYYVLIVGTIVVGVVMPFSESGTRIINAALFSIVLAELVHHGVAAASYRLGWND